MVCIGTIVKCRKIEGHFLCRLFSCVFVDDQHLHRLSGLREIELRKPHYTAASLSSFSLSVESIELFQPDSQGKTDTILLKSHAWNAPEDVQPYHGWELWVDDEYAAQCEEGEFLYCDLIGSVVYTYQKIEISHADWPTFVFLGFVSGLLEGSAQLLLEIELYSKRYPQEQSIYLPFHDSIIGQVQWQEIKQLNSEFKAEAPRLSIEVLDLEYFESLLL